MECNVYVCILYFVITLADTHKPYITFSNHHSTTNSAHAPPNIQQPSHLVYLIAQALNLDLDSTGLGIASSLERLDGILEREPVRDQITELDDAALD